MYKKRELTISPGRAFKKRFKITQRLCGFFVPVRGAYYRVGPWPYLSPLPQILPLKGAHNSLYVNTLDFVACLSKKYAPPTGAMLLIFMYKRRGEPLRYNMSSLRDSLSEILSILNTLPPGLWLVLDLFYYFTTIETIETTFFSWERISYRKKLSLLSLLSLKPLFFLLSLLSLLSL